MARSWTAALRGLGLLIILSATAPFAVGAAAQAPDGDSIERGRAYLVKQCGACHAAGREDKSANPAATPLRVIAARYNSDPILAGALTSQFVGLHPNMPVFRPSQDELKDIIGYLRTVQPPANFGG